MSYKIITTGYIVDGKVIGDEIDVHIDLYEIEDYIKDVFFKLAVNFSILESLLK